MEKSNRKVQYWAAFAVALASLTSNASFSWTTPVIPKFHNNETALTVTDTEISWVVVTISPGMMVGTVTTQYQLNNFGRRPTLLSSAVPICVGTLFILFATNVWMMYIARFLWGFGAAMIQTVTMIYLAEIASKEIRGSLVVGNSFMFNFGGFLVVAVGSFASYQTLSYMLIALPIMYFFACWFVSETPYYLLKEGKVDAARTVLMKLNGYKDEKVLEQKLTEMHKHVKEDMRRSTTVKELFTGKQYRKALLISFGLKVFQQLSGSLLIQQYLGRIMQETETSVSISSGLILYAALRFVISMLSSGIVDKVGRRPLLIFSYIGSCVTFAVVGACFFVQEVVPVEENANLLGNIIFFGIIVFSIVSTIGYDTLMFVVPAEIFPLNVKSIAITSMNLFGSVVTFITIRGYQIIKDLWGLTGVFWFFASMCLVGAGFSYWAVPETKGKSLREIQMELQGSLYEEESEIKMENVEISLLNGNEQEKYKQSVLTSNGDKL